jgi:hypothetical protein
LNEFEFLTSCTVIGDIRTEPVIIGCGLGSEEADYGHPNFFGNITYDLRDRFGLFLQAASRRFGRGRVLLFTDSTCFSNFCIFGPGRRDLILGFMDYLNREGTKYPWVRPGAFLLFGLLVAVPHHGLRHVREGSRLRILGVCAGLVIGACVIGWVNSVIHGPLPDKTVSPSILFETGHTDATYSNYLGLARSRSRRGFEQFYLCARRVGMYPSAGDISDIEEVAPRGVVLAEPCKAFSKDEREHLLSYVNEGGRLLVLDSILNERSTANEILGRFGMMVYVDTDPGDPPGAAVTARLRVHGGEVLKEDDSGNAIVAAANVEAGVVAVAVDSFRYSEHLLGVVLQKGKLATVTSVFHRDACSLLQATFLEDSIP